jgi:ribosome-associated toxin RatA of RatAB toxin-antitoxin module
LQVVERSAIVTFTAAQMFALVDDVSRYPEFLPWCSGAQVEVISATERLATVKVARGLMRTEFTTRNTLTPDTQIFEAIGGRGSRVHFRVEFEFKSRLTAAAFNSVFEALCGTIVDAFVVRAQKIYG